MASVEEKSQSYQKNGYDIVRLEVISNQGGDPIDLKTHFIELVLYESIFDDKMFGEIVLIDGLNYSETLPIVGNETIYISFKTATFKKPVELVARVFSVVGRGRTTNEKNDVYKLQFVSIPQFENHTRRVAGSKKGNIAKIASDIFNENFGTSFKLFIDPTDSKTFQYVIPYWSPLFALSWLSKRAFSPINQTKYNPSTFIFYEDMHGFHFVDLVKKFNQRTRFTYRVEPSNPANQTDVNRFFEQVQEYTISNYFDRLMEFNMGMYSSTLLTHDITTKKLMTYDLSYNDHFNEYNHLNKYPLIPISNRKFSDSKLACRSFLPVQADRNKIIDKNDDPEDYYLDSASIEKQLDTVRITAVVAGNSDIRLLDVVDFEIPKGGYLDVDEKDWKDIYLSGRYLVVSIKHTINKDVGVGYNTTIELAKDSLIKGIPDVIEKKGNQNR